MSAVARLLFACMLGVPWLRWFSVAGLLILVASGYALSTLAPSGALVMTSFVGMALLFVGSGLMPATLARFARSRQAQLLRHGRIKIFIAALLVVALIALPAPIITMLAVIGATPESVLHSMVRPGVTLLEDLRSAFFVRQYLLTFMACTWLYVAVWFATSTRDVAGLTRALTVPLLILWLPGLVDLRGTFLLTSPFILASAVILVSWLIIGAYLLLPVHVVDEWRAGWSALFARRSTRSQSGRELDLLLGTATPWALALAQVIPMLVAKRFIFTEGVWLFYLTIFSTVSGAIAGNAAMRSRAIWLLTGDSRADLFALAEHRFWRHNSYSLGVLLLLLAGIGYQSQLPTTMLLFGAPLLVLGTLVSTYLGLMMTRGLRWPESLLAIAVMVTLITTAVLAAEVPVNMPLVLALETALLGVALTCRTWAQRRWCGLDWMELR